MSGPDRVDLWGSRRVWSLWDVIQLNPNHFLASLTYLASTQKFFAVMRHELIEKNSYACIDGSQIEEMAKCAFMLKGIAESLDMPASIGSADRLVDAAAQAFPHAAMITPKSLGPLVEAAAALIGSFHDEMEARLIFVMPPRHGAFYTDEPLFGPDVENAFPSSAPEITEAGKCRALGRWTASVMHLMRALEPALLALQDAVQVNVPKEQWDQIINQVDSKIREITKRSHGKADEQWYSEAASHFRLIKNAWRNHAQHLHERYDEERAVVIYDSVRAFMRHLATRLSESP